MVYIDRIKIGVIALLFASALFIGCSSSESTDSADKEVVEEMDVLETELESVTEELDAGISDLKSDVDSLLEGI